jgi:hypothetical protein
MTMPREVYTILQQAFSRTRSYEAQAVELERQAEQLRIDGMKIQQEAYDAIHAAYTNLKEQS